MSSRELSVEQDNWPRSQEYRRSMRLEFSLYVSVLIILLMSATGYVITQRYEKTVTTGLTWGDKIEVIEGIIDSISVIVDGHRSLQEGEPISIIKK